MYFVDDFGRIDTTLCPYFLKHLWKQEELYRSRDMDIMIDIYAKATLPASISLSDIWSSSYIEMSV